jgi:Virulence-associated protein E
VQRLYHTLPAQSTPSSAFIGHPPHNRSNCLYINYKKCKFLCYEHIEPWQSHCWYDVVRQRAMVDTESLNDMLEGQAALALERIASIPIHNMRLVHTALLFQCRKNPRDLLQEWLQSLPPWDGVERLTEWLYDHAGVVKTAYTMDVSRLLIVSLVARALHPGCQYRNVIILEGPENAGKSKLLKIGPFQSLEQKIGLSKRFFRSVRDTRI